MGIRLGPTVSGASTHWAQSGTSTPPELLETSLLEWLVSPRAQGQIRFPPPVANTAASLGSSHMAYRGATAAMNQCEAGEFAPTGFAGTSSPAHAGPRTDVAQRA